MSRHVIYAVTAAVCVFSSPATVQFTPSKESISDLYPGSVYSPYAQRSFPSYPLWGDTHLHTGLSVDAGLFGARLGLEEAYRFARGEEVISSTTGSPMAVRFFGGWDYAADDLNSRQPAFRGYKKGVPMGGDLRPRSGPGGPTFMVYAQRDPIGANLDRIQIIKGWLDAAGKTHEKVYDVAWSPGREPGVNGVLPAVGSTVNVQAANWTNTVGASELGTVWTDPDFDPEQHAFYYARVIEIPTPRWIVYDAFRYGVDIPEGAETIHQERAYTSPIWYAPKS
jgi:hypothetical protein